MLDKEKRNCSSFKTLDEFAPRNHKKMMLRDKESEDSADSY